MQWTEQEYQDYLLRHSPLTKLTKASRETESDFQNWVIREAKHHGWLVYHTHDSRKSEPGFPDLVMTNGKRVIFAELKTNASDSKPSSAQARWLLMLTHAGQEVWIWRPRDKAEILARLQTREGRHGD